jgi:DNA ligase-1
VRLSQLVEVSEAVAATSGRLEKISRLASLIESAGADELPIIVSFLSGSPRQGRVGIGGASLSELSSIEPVADPQLSLGDVDATFDRVKSTSGTGSSARRAELLRSLFSRATRGEQQFLIRVLVGELRQGALEGVLADAIARAAKVPLNEIRRAVMVTGSLPQVATIATSEGSAGLARLAMELMRPVDPMLADAADTVADALARSGRSSVEYKIDGARVQIHKAGDEVRVFTRNLRDVTPAVPELVTMARALPVRAAILDGEAIALRPGGPPHPFQVTMRRFGRRLDVETLRRELPLTPFLFDLLQIDDEPLVDEPLARRAEALASIAPSLIVPRLIAPNEEQAETFLREALERGHEGVMVKALDAPYAAGRRGQAWLKVKQARTLDLVVLAAEWGHGRRRGWLSNLHLGARNPEKPGWVMLGKTFKGMTDEMPELVVEVAFNDLQESPQYPGGLALRFARVKRYRPDKSADKSDTLATVQKIYKEMTGNEPPPVRS